ncbi:MAG TPA: hypothetical protein PLB90_11900, partial [Opitutaceae bacterium]|nr:hypothetical protein [Opitutaceae bacterium]
GTPRPAARQSRAAPAAQQLQPASAKQLAAAERLGPGRLAPAAESRSDRARAVTEFLTATPAASASTFHRPGA